ncbi:MAG: hypothetical protein KDC26_07090 [Armatimonadetes bacterium]|nr:hypothetical protein [Armatimonadota bacterium]
MSTTTNVDAKVKLSPPVLRGDSFETYSELAGKTVRVKGSTLFILVYDVNAKEYFWKEVYESEEDVPK